MQHIKKILLKSFIDKRGCLIAMEEWTEIPFSIERIFFIKNTGDIPRGFHSHKTTLEIVIPISGSFKLDLTDGKEQQTFLLEKDNEGILIPTNIWLKLYDFSVNCIILAICSKPIIKGDYIRDYQEFLTLQDSSKKIIPFVSLTEQTQQLKPHIMKKFSELLDNTEFVLGSELELFEKNFATYHNVKYCVGVSNGTSALVAALKALQLNNGEEVIVQANTYIAAPLAIEMANLSIKIVDIDPNTLNLDLDLLEQSITEKTKVVIVVHLYGTCPNMDKLIAIKEKYNLFLIEDTAQAHGSTYKGKKLGTFGEMGCFSFYPGKNLGCFGDGGALITNNYDYYIWAKKYRNYGCIEKYKSEIKGSNERLHNLQAGVLNIKLPHLDRWNLERNRVAEIYNKELSEIKEIRLPVHEEGLYRNYHVYLILVNDRDSLKKYLEEHDIQCNIHYPQTFYHSEAFKELNHLTFKADNIKGQLLSLPIYPELSNEDAIQVCRVIKNYELERAFPLLR